MSKKLIFTVLIIQIMSGLLYSQNTTKNILIAYASFSGSTKEIVDSMQTYITNGSALVDTFAAAKKKIELSKYDLIFIGSAIRGNAPHPKILEFIDVNRAELTKKEIAIFVVCGTITSSKKSKRENALTYPDKVANGLNPKHKIVFGGYMPSEGKKFNDFLGKLLLGVEPGDYRDWGQIKKWTTETTK